MTTAILHRETFISNLFFPLQIPNPPSSMPSGIQLTGAGSMCAYTSFHWPHFLLPLYRVNVALPHWSLWYPCSLVTLASPVQVCTSHSKLCRTTGASPRDFMACQGYPPGQSLPQGSSSHADALARVQQICCWLPRTGQRAQATGRLYGDITTVFYSTKATGPQALLNLKMQVFWTITCSGHKGFHLALGSQALLKQYIEPF
jgi:hypothetical protein